MVQKMAMSFPNQVFEVLKKMTAMGGHFFEDFIAIFSSSDNCGLQFQSQSSS